MKYVLAIIAGASICAAVPASAGEVGVGVGVGPVGAGAGTAPRILNIVGSQGCAARHPGERRVSVFGGCARQGLGRGARQRFRRSGSGLA